MKILNKLFTGIKMTWLKVIIFAVLSAALTAFLLICPATSDTSLGNIGVNPECWILFAIIIIMNCEKPVEAGLKTFVYFLVSQPLIYLIEVPFTSDGWSLFRFYPKWFIITVLCLPGGMIAWYVRKNNVLSALILSVATGGLCLMGVTYINYMMTSFPKNLLSTVFCFVVAAILIVVLLKGNKERLIAAGISVLAGGIFAVMLFGFSSVPTASSDYALEEGHDWQIVSEAGDAIGSVKVDPDNSANLLIFADAYGEETVVLENEEGEQTVLTITYDKKTWLQVNETE